ncbi:MAG: carboxypeptidase-like regulatory domain-containing protein [Bacteroidales bacterium]|nr:carboxypeptidase-like regulatory domain-containing protein [Bacteroidales bacterium]MBN2749104.1 carboxypeptidase-like regulatory domain-containing protein [Bacteroidales bacterium]
MRNSCFLCFSLVLLVVLFLNGGAVVSAQSVQGAVTNEHGEPIVYASIYVKELRMGTSANANGRYLINLPAGEYSVVFRSLGFETVEEKVLVSNNSVHLNVTLAVRPYQIAPVTIGSKAEDPAYAIIRKAIGYAPYYQNQVKEFDAEVYLKGTIKVKKLSWIVKKAIKDDPDAPKEGDLYLQESVNNIHFTAPNKYDQTVKLIRSNFPEGNDASDNVMRFTNASFYQPQVGDVVLPLAPNALRFYSYRYDGFSIQDNRVIYKIKVIPKRKSKQLVAGYLYIADEYYNLHEVDLQLEAVFGLINIRQSFGEVEKDVWLPISYFFTLDGSFLGNQGSANFVSSVKYSSVEVDKALKAPSALAVAFKQRSTQERSTPAPQKSRKQAKQSRDSLKMDALLQKESFTNREMYQLSKLMNKRFRERDTTAKPLEVVDPVTITVDSSARDYKPEAWQQLRPLLFTNDEVVADSAIQTKLIAASNSAASDTSSDSEGSVLGTVVFGNSWYNRDKRQTIEFSGIANPTHFQFNTVDGFVLGASFKYERAFEHTVVAISPALTYAFSRKVPMGSIQAHFTYANKRRGKFGVDIGSTSSNFNAAQGVSKLVNTPASLLFGRNYMKLYGHTYIKVSNQIDIANGLELFAQLELSEREALSNTTSYIFVSQNRARYTPNQPENSRVEPSNLSNSKAFITQLQLSYTPFYYYEMRRNRKRMLYSKFPTLTVMSRFAQPGILGSQASFAQLQGAVQHRIRTGSGSSFSYSVKYGGFLSSKSMFFSDFVHFNSHASPVIARSFYQSFQSAGYYNLSTNSSYGQVMATYQTPYLALKFLPFLSNRMWLESVHLSLLKLNGEKPYAELGYSLSRIGAFASVGMFAGFEGSHFSSVSFKVAFSFLDND